MSATNLDYLFQDQIRNFAHLITIAPKTKSEFLQTVKETYSTENPKTAMFCASLQRSTFDTIRLNSTRDAILFNQ